MGVPSLTFRSHCYVAAAFFTYLTLPLLLLLLLPQAPTWVCPA
jgi:hypothetical protein